MFVANRHDLDNILYKNNGDGSFYKISTGNIVNDGGNAIGNSCRDCDFKYYKIIKRAATMITETKLDSCVDTHYVDNEIAKNERYMYAVRSVDHSGNESEMSHISVAINIDTIINKTMSEGSHQVEFNTSNLPSSVYYYRIEEGVYQEVKKMILLK